MLCFDAKIVPLMILICSSWKEFLNEQLSSEEEEKEKDGMDDLAMKNKTGTQLKLNILKLKNLLELNIL